MTEELLKQANELVNELWVYECTDCDFKSTGMGVIKHPRCPVCKGKNVCERGYISRLTIIKTLADELRASNETINRQHEMAQKQEKTIKTLSNELRQLESEYDALLNKLGDKCCACSVDKITDICMSHQPRVSELEAVVKEACDYLDTNELTTIGSTSILHRKFKNAIKPPKEQIND